MTHAKKPAKKAATRTQELTAEWKKAHPFKFVNIPLTDDEKALILESVPEMLEVVQWVMNAPRGDGYKIGVGYDFQSMCYQVSVTGILYGREDYNRCVTSRHSDFDVAFGIAMYKHSQYCTPEIPPPADQQPAGNVFD